MQTIRLTDEEVMEVLKCITYFELELQEALGYSRGEVQQQYYREKVDHYRSLWNLVFTGGHDLSEVFDNG